MKKRKSLNVIILLTLIFTILMCVNVCAAPKNLPIPKVNVSIDSANAPKEYVDNIKLLIMFTVLTLLPSFIIMVTCFVRIIVVFSFLKNAMGTQQALPSQVLMGLALFLTIFIMTPTITKINNEAIDPYLNNKISQEVAYKKGTAPIRSFMLKQTRKKDLKLFMETANVKEDTKKENIPLRAVIPAFMISELKTAFEIGFLLFIPFLIIDLVVASVLMSMGMFMLPPVMISLPFKILLFVMVDGWYLIVKSLILSFK